MKKTIFLAAFALLALVMACTEDTVTMRYHMSSCNDPWMRDTAYQNNKTAVLKQFLVNKGVSVKSLTITSDCTKSEICLACVCKGCDFATVEVREDDEVTMEGLGFKRQ